MTYNALLISFALSFIVAAFPVRTAAQGQLFVEVKSSKLRGTPRYYGPAVGEVNYGDALNLVSQDGAWYRVETSSGLKGFLHQSAVTTRKVVLKGSSMGVDPSSDEIVLAGKGFNGEAESELASAGNGLNYEAVDIMEGWRVDAASLERFLLEGKLNT